MSGRKWKPRELTGVLRIMPAMDNLGPTHFLRTDDGDHWRLEVEAERVHWLNGLAVRVRGESSGRVIRVGSIVQA